MKLNTYAPEKVTEGLLLSFARNFDTLIGWTIAKPQETLEFISTKRMETSSTNTFLYQ